MNAPNKAQNDQFGEIYDRFLQRYVPVSAIQQVKNSSFLEIITIAFVFGAQNSIYDHCQFKGTRDNELVIRVIQHTKQIDHKKAEIELRSVQRLIEKFSLLQDIEKTGQNIAAKMLSNNNPSTTDHSPLSDLIAEHINHSMLDLPRHGFTKTYLNYLKRATATDASSHKKSASSKPIKKISYILLWIIVGIAIISSALGMFILQNTQLLEDNLQQVIPSK